MKDKLKNNKAAIIVAAVACACIVLLCVMFVANARKDPLREQLDLGSKYLDELDYDAALASFLAAIEIDPMNPEGYAGAAEAYVGLGDPESAVDILREGFERTQDAGLSERLKELEEMLQGEKEQEELARKQQEEKERQEQEAKEQAEREQREQEEAAKQSESASGATGGADTPITVPETDDPFAELLFAPYSSENIPYEVEDYEAMLAYADSVDALNNLETDALLDDGRFYHVFSPIEWSYGDSGAEVFFSKDGTATDYFYVDGEIREAGAILTTGDWSPTKEFSPTGGIADYAVKYGCASIEDFLRSFGIEDEALYTALAAPEGSYTAETETAYGAVKTDVTTGADKRRVTMQFDEGTGAPWVWLCLGDGHASWGLDYLFVKGSKLEVGGGYLYTAYE